MTKIKFDYVYLNNNVCSNVSDSVLELNRAYNKLSGGISVPNDFSYYTFVKNLDSKISDIISDLNYFNSWIVSCNKSFSTLEDGHEKRVNDIRDRSLNKRNMII